MIVHDSQMHDPHQVDGGIEIVESPLEALETHTSSIAKDEDLQKGAQGIFPHRVVMMFGARGKGALGEILISGTQDYNIEGRMGETMVDMDLQTPPTSMHKCFWDNILMEDGSSPKCKMALGGPPLVSTRIGINQTSRVGLAIAGLANKTSVKVASSPGGSVAQSQDSIQFTSPSASLRRWSPGTFMRKSKLVPRDPRWPLGDLEEEIYRSILEFFRLLTSQFGIRADQRGKIEHEVWIT